ncbi:GIY-YIG nuclease family protein [Actinosynnema pretiosum subsp. pretiosum]|uniref:GIY-YIG nuclease family protein n=1 Tax=Actinosynnema pretiosum subsp. pretiosum TaxID=103721 RepID=A0AA45R3Z0_9PSEU|nr:hypothetical protein APASM_4247 [Actinosynnema pretiosum subsp. pretiosum]QUF04367.1 GIY-YIG nuclease family protein [Actinosynnema pretiosum subsp. pretiosum]
MTTPSEASAIEEFARKLRELRIDCGEPSYATISRLTRTDQESISVGSVHTLLAGQRQTKPEIVRAFVRAVLRHRDGAARPEHAGIVDEWFALWRATRLESQTRTTGPAATPRETPPPASPQAGDVSSASTAHRPGIDRDQLVTPRVRSFLAHLEAALASTDEQGRRWGSAKYGCYAFYDYDGEPIYVGQTNERVQTRVRRHLSNQRTDAVAMRVLDVQEVAELELWPLWEHEDVDRTGEAAHQARQHLDAVESTIYERLLAESRFGMLLNERVPATAEPVELPASRRFALVDDQTRREWGSAAVRIARRASTLARLADTAVERGVVSDGLRRAILVQGVRLTQLAASAYATASGTKEPVVQLQGLEVREGIPLT